MSEPISLIFAVPSELDATLDGSRIPKAATIFYHENRWWFELKTGQAWSNELHQHENNFNGLRRFPDRLDFALGPFDFQSVDIEIELSDEGNRLLYSIISINGCRLGRPVQRTRSPIVPIRLTGGGALDAARIPDGATHYCWLNGSDMIESNLTDAEPNEAAMLLLGGLAYLDNSQADSYRVMQINRFQPGESGRLQFTGSKKWRSEYTQTLVDQDRFARCPYFQFMEGRIHYYAFINANEEFISSNDYNDKWIPTQNGAFLYLFNEDKSPNDQDCYYELSPVALGTPVSDTH